MKQQIIKGKALRRVWNEGDTTRLLADIPLMTSKVEIITPQTAQQMLTKNNNNRPVKWDKVTEYRRIMESGGWKLHQQGIVLDSKDNILTGQNRLWAIVQSNIPVAMYVSRGTPEECAILLDRHAPQSSQDLAYRRTRRKHSPTEASIARASIVAEGGKPTKDAIADVLVNKEHALSVIMREAKGTKKTKALLMILAIVLTLAKDDENLIYMVKRSESMANELIAKTPEIDKCWGRGVAFTMALDMAKQIVVAHMI